MSGVIFPIYPHMSGVTSHMSGVKYLNLNLNLLNRFDSAIPYDTSTRVSCDDLIEELLEQCVFSIGLASDASNEQHLVAIWQQL